MPETDAAARLRALPRDGDAGALRCHRGARPPPFGADPGSWRGFRVRAGMRWVEVDAGRWLLEIGDGFGMEIVLLFSRTVAFWRFRGELVAEVTVGEG